MRTVELRYVCVIVSDEMMEFSAHRRELMQKLKELESYILSIETGKTELWA